jgi:enoyl-CoA hydratase
MSDRENDFEKLHFAVTDGVARITLARPEYRNAQSVQLVEELDRAFSKARHDDDVRAVVLDGEGSSFSAGHDLGSPEESEEIEYRSKAGIRAVGSRSWDLYSETTMRWRDLPKPTIAAVQGHCIYAGWSLASAMDIVIAADDARFLPHLSEFFSLPWIVGTRRAKEILMLERTLDAAEALALGMVTEVVPAAELTNRAMQLATEIAARDPAMMRLIKGAVNAVEDTMGFQASVRTGQAYNVLGYFGGHLEEMAAADDPAGEQGPDQ